jgi:alkylation response protein AidB-like acyl-CoA dehydrogenase
VSHELLDAARSLRTTLDANAEKAGSGPVSHASVEAMRQAGLFGVMCPRDVGGAELPLDETIDVFAEVARADGSTGWCLMAVASCSAYFGAYCEQSFVDRLFADGTPLAAGQFAPNGSGVRVEGGIRITGNYQFGSGIEFADWAGAGILVPPGDGSDAPPEYRFALVPKDRVELRGNWNVLGLTSTASFDYGITDVVVPEEATFLFAAPTRHRGGPVYDLGVIALTAAGHAGFAIGVVRRALDELRVVARSKVRMGAGTFMKDSEAFLLKLGVLESRHRAATAWVRESFVALERSIVDNGEIDKTLYDQARQATVFATQDGAEVVREAYLAAGTSALREGALQRCFRDIHAGSQHFFASPASTLDMATDLMADTPESALECED